MTWRFKPASPNFNELFLTTSKDAAVVWDLDPAKGYLEDNDFGQRVYGTTPDLTGLEGTLIIAAIPNWLGDKVPILQCAIASDQTIACNANAFDTVFCIINDRLSFCSSFMPGATLLNMQAIPIVY